MYCIAIHLVAFVQHFFARYDYDIAMAHIIVMPITYFRAD